MSNRFAAGVAAIAFAAASCDATDAPDVPVASLSIGAGPLFGDAAIGLSLSDKQSRLVNLELRFGVGSADRPATPATGAISLRGLPTSPEGMSHVFAWDTVADLGYGRTEAVALSLQLTAGVVDGIGDEVGPLVVDNSSLPRFGRVSGRACRAEIMYGTPAAGGDHRGKLYVGLYSDLRYPPLSQSVDGVDLGVQDLSEPATCIPYAFDRVSPGEYQVIAVLDDNENNTSFGAYSVDRGDATNVELGVTPSAARVTVAAGDVQRDLFLNYYVP